MYRLNIPYKQFYVTLNEIWLNESDPNAPSTWSEPGGKQWQRSIRGRRNWDVELGPCAVIRHLRSVAFVWETKRPQADNSRSLIDRQVSCYTIASTVSKCCLFCFYVLVWWKLKHFAQLKGYKRRSCTVLFRVTLDMLKNIVNVNNNGLCYKNF